MPKEADDAAGPASEGTRLQVAASAPAAAAAGTGDAAAEWTPLFLRRMEAAAADGLPPAEVLEQWQLAYQQMAADAQTLGIPASAIPQLPAQPTAAELRAARDRLSGMMASFLSAGL
ncbi:type VII secretion [Chlorella sorokiniana]|uniref:Type VII secretion (Plasmid) n=1 Tax=Chlorella sorokiniana TaxID=3076 RepID=A0A2P6TPD8_CHLSO|nr:type VII secretion [Chlorella sorokiniana]|eukprot:PRW55894.1 type VII secretion [Chlorella sorokiniana]